MQLIFIEEYKIVKQQYNYFVSMVRIIDNYTLFEIIGEGSYGKVYRAVNKIDKKQYAVKVIEAKKFHADKKLEEYTVNQINILTNIEKNAHIIGYFDMLKSQTNFYFVYQFCNGGTLQGLLDKQKKLPETEALKILKQLLTAFKLLYKFHVMHRDLKPDNIFFKDGVVKLGDFGFCKNIQKTKMTKTMLGSPIYMAPQILRGEVYSSKADIWSIGVVLFQMLYGYCPFQSSSIPKLLKILQQTDVVFPNNAQVSGQTKDLLKKILTKNPKYRIQWDQLLQIKITQDGKLINEKNPSRHFFAAQRKGSWGTYTTNNLEKIATSNSNKSLTKCQEMFPTKRQQKVYQIPMTTKNNYSRNHSTSHFCKSEREKQVKPAVVTQKKCLPSVQQSTDDQSRKYKIFRRQKGFTRVKNIINLENAQDKNFSTTENLRALLRAQSNNIDCQSFFVSKQKVVAKHSEIIQGNSIARNLQCVGQKHSNLFSQFIYKTILQRLVEFKAKLQSNGGYQQIVNLVSQEIEQFTSQMKRLQKDYPQGLKILQTPNYVVQMKRQLKDKIPECRHLRLCYEVVMFVMNETACNALKSEQMQKIINLKLSC